MKRIIPVVAPTPKNAYVAGDIVDDGKARYRIDRVEDWEVFSTNLDTGQRECFWDTAYLDYYIELGKIRYEPIPHVGPCVCEDCLLEESAT